MINLFRSRKKGFFDKFMKWALGVGRFVVIITETIALLAFLYRFTLDQQLVDLHSEIKNKQTLVKLLKDNEDIYRNLQDRLTLAKTFTETGKQTASVFTDIVKHAPTDITFTKFLLLENQVKIDAQTESAKTIKDFIKTLKSYPQISSVSLDRIENRTTNATIIVSITALLKTSAIATPSAENKVQ